MAEAESGGGWWASMLSAAKEKSVSALSATKRDLAEFVSVLSNDTSSAVQNASDNIRSLIQQETSEEEAKHSKSPLSHPPSSTSVTLTPAHPPGVPYDRSQAQLFALQSSSDTFLSDPHGAEMEFEKWAGQFVVQSRQSEISQLLVNCPHVRTLHSQLVPAKVSYESFWQRYFFKLNLLQQEEQRRAELMARVEPQTRQEDLEWEELEEGEIGELCGEVGRGEGEKGAKDENRSQEERDKNGGRKERDVADDATEVSSSVVEIKSDHLRSESSDSFVCVSEDLPPHSDRSHASPDDGNGGGGDWEYLKMGGGVSGESSEGGDVTVTPVKQEDRGGIEKDQEKEKEASELSDWESWDD